MAYNNIDGVGELSIGFMCLGFGLMSWLQVSSPEGSFWTRMTTFYGYMAVMCAIIHFGCKTIKKHITYPRTGFVQYRRRDAVWRPMIIGFAVSFVFSILLIMMIKRHWNFTNAGSLIGLFFAVPYALKIAPTVRWKWIVFAIMVVAMVVIAMLPADALGALAKGSWITRAVPAKLVGAYLLTMGFFGSLVFFSGAISFWLYLRQTHAQ